MNKIKFLWLGVLLFAGIRCDDKISEVLAKPAAEFGIYLMKSGKFKNEKLVIEASTEKLRQEDGKPYGTVYYTFQSTVTNREKYVLMAQYNGTAKAIVKIKKGDKSWDYYPEISF